MFGRTDSLIFSYGVIALSLAAAGFDIAWGRIFNWLTLAGFVAGLAFAGYHSGLSGIGLGLAGAGVALLAYGWMFALRVIGGGDLKLLMALGAWGGPEFTLKIAILAIVLGGVMAAGILLFKGRLGDFARRMKQFLLSVFVRELEVEKPRLDAKHTMPFGIPIAAAAIWLVLQDPFLVWGFRLWS